MTTHYLLCVFTAFRSKLVQYSVFIHIPPAETSKLMNSGYIYIVALVSITVAISASLPYSGSILLAYKLVTSKQPKLKMKITFSFSDMILT